MIILDIFKIKKIKKTISCLEQKNQSLVDRMNLYDSIFTDEHRQALDLAECIQKLEKQKLEIENSIREVDQTLLNKTSELVKLNHKIKEKENQIIELDDNILLQDFGLYKPIYDFISSNQYKEQLDLIRNQQKEMIKEKTAVDYYDGWTVDGSITKGRKMTNDNIKQIIRSFNNECEVLIDKVKFNNIEVYEERIRKSFSVLNKMNETNKVSLSNQFLKSKINELKLAYEYAKKKQEEKEEQKRIREQLREEAKLQKEIEEARKDIEKEQSHYSNALSKVLKQLENANVIEKEALIEKKTEIEKHLEELNMAIKDIDYREANKKAGYVYVISNIGAFGENIFKIGMTRRLDPQERIDELGDASVPFKFDIHAMIFSDNAPQLEAALHRAFENQKVNMINNRREFFKVTLKEIEEVVKINYDKSVDFIKIAPAEQFRESLKLKERLTNNN